MTLSAVTSIAITGMQAAATQFSTSASNIANIETADYQRKSTHLSSVAAGGTVASISVAENRTSIDENLYDLIGAKIAYEANASVFETGADLWQVLATIKRD